jgi:hypothetical protein
VEIVYCPKTKANKEFGFQPSTRKTRLPGCGGLQISAWAASRPISSQKTSLLTESR